MRNPYRIEPLTPEQRTSYPGVPDYYLDLRPSECLLLGIWDSVESKDTEDWLLDEMLGCAVVTPMVMDPDTVTVSFIRFTMGIDFRLAFRKLFTNIRGLIRRGGKKRILFWTMEVEGSNIGELTPEILTSIGCTEEKNPFYCGGWALRDIYDTYFLSKQVPRIEQDPHLEKLHSFTRIRCMQLFRRLGVKEGSYLTSSTIESPLSRVYMDGRTPLGMVLAEKPLAQVIVLSGVYFPDTNDWNTAFRATMAGALGAALEGEGLDALLVGRFIKKAYLKELEELLGPAEVHIVQRSFIYHL